MKLHIKKNINGDTRSAKSIPTIDDLHVSNINHINDVRKVLYMLSDILKSKADNHDHTKLDNEDLFYRDFINSMTNNSDFKDSEWYKLHIESEKHHPLSYLHNDFDILDLLETLADGICAGLSRSGEFKPFNFDSEILQKAVDNTCKFILDNIKIDINK